MRSFIGIGFDKQFKNEISALQSKLRSEAKSGRWKYVDNFHLTLKFLGEIDESTATKICDALKELFSNKHSFKLNVSELGNFKGNGYERVLWLGLGGDIEKLFSITKELDKRLLKIGIQKEKRKFTPHITIGQDIVFIKEFSKIKQSYENMQFSLINVDCIKLYKSEQIGNKRVYTSCFEVSLKKET